MFNLHMVDATISIHQNGSVPYTLFFSLGHIDQVIIFLPSHWIRARSPLKCIHVLLFLGDINCFPKCAVKEEGNLRSFHF